jgi:2-polyprenyl-6-methoxyphenol hydroxylase-like FAD-dependent oxidoreductase
MKVAILGAGIGGLTTALALKKKGMSIPVFEAADEIRAVGAGIWMPPNAMRVFDKLGIGDEIRKSGIQLKQLEVRDFKDALISIVDGAELEKKYGSRTVSIERSKLHHIIASALDPNQVNLGYACAHVFIEENQVRLDFKNGENAFVDQLIASDGLKSVTRQTYFKNRQLRYSGQTCFRGLITMKNFKYFQDSSVEFWGNGTRFGMSPVGTDKYYWYSTIVGPSNQSFSQQQMRDFVRNHFQDYPASVKGILDSFESCEIIHTDLFDLNPDDIWVHDRIVLLGDSAHATTPNLGQGAAMAVEDAYKLAEEMSKTPDCKKSFSNYNQKRKDRVAFIVETSFKIAQLSNSTNPNLNKFRNFIFKMMPKFLMQKQLDKIYGAE